MSICGHWNKGLFLIISTFLLSFSFASFSDEPVESANSNKEEVSSDKPLECVIDDEILGCWTAVEREKDCKSDIAAYSTDEPNQLICFNYPAFVADFLYANYLEKDADIIRETFIKSIRRIIDVLPEAPLVLVTVDHSATKECGIKDDVSGCWTAVESEKDCESGTTFYQTDESDQLLCFTPENTLPEIILARSYIKTKRDEEMSEWLNNKLARAFNKLLSENPLPPPPITVMTVVDGSETKECIEGDVSGCWTTVVENEEDCESGTTFYQIDESDQKPDQIFCLVPE